VAASLHQQWIVAMSPNEKSYFKDMGRRIADRRKELSLTQTQLAEILGIPQQTYASYEVGRHGFPIAMLPALAQALAMETDVLIGATVKTRSKRGPAPKLLQHIERINQLPKAKQRFVMEMLETVLAQQSR
jgi:transcriptional regulator with XRE-family HTH domain